MTITDHPLHRSGQAELPHPAPTLGDDAKALERIRVTNVGGRKPSIDQPIHMLPIQPLSFTPTPQRKVPVTANLEPEALDRSTVGRHAVVAGKAADHRPNPPSLFGNRRMHTLSQFGFDLLKFPTQPLANRLADDRIYAITPLLPANMRESQEVECLRSPLIAPLPVIDRKRTELQKPRFLGVQRQAELVESRLEFRQTPFRLSHTALRRPFIDGLPSALFHHAGSQPFLDETHNARITNPMLDKLHEPSVVESIEELTDVGIDDPVHFLRQQPDIERIQAVMLATSRPVSVRETEKLRFVDGVENQDRRILDDLLFQHRHSQCPLLSIGFGNVDSTNRFCPVSPAFQSSAEILEMLFQILFVVPPRLPINASGRVALEAVVGLPQRIGCRYVVHEACELEFLILQCALTYPSQRVLHPVPALNPVDVLLRRVSFGRKASNEARYHACTFLFQRFTAELADSRA
jgi:hypothetical protein